MVTKCFCPCELATRERSVTERVCDSQLSQKFIVVPLKLRFVTLIALLRSIFAQAPGQRATKIIVFLSCTDSVDFHFNILGGTSMNEEEESESSEAESDGLQTESEVGTSTYKKKNERRPVEKRSKSLSKPGRTTVRRQIQKTRSCSMSVWTKFKSQHNLNLM